MATQHLWHLEAASGTRVDSIGERDLTVTGTDSVSASTGIIGDALNAASGFGALGSAANRGLDCDGGNAFSISGWAYFDNAAGTAEYLCAYETATEVIFGLQRLASGVIEGTVRNLNDDVYTVTGTTLTSASTWYFVTLTFARSGVVRILVNGIQEDSTPTANSRLKSAYDSPLFTLASQDGNANPMVGRLDEWSVDDTALSTPEVAALYNGGTGVDRELSYDGDVATGLVHLWRMEESSGARVDTENGLDFTTVVGDMGNAPGFLGNAMLFDNNHNYLQVLATSLINAADEATISVWARFDDPVGSREAVVRISSPSGLPFLYILDRRGNGVPDHRFFSSSGTNTQTPNAPVLTDGVTYHMVGVYKRGGYQRLYVNGTALTSGETGMNDEALNDVSASPFIRMGSAHNDGNQMGNGIFDEVSIHNRALSAGDVAKLYNGGTPLNLAPPMMMQEGYVTVLAAVDEEVGYGVDVAGIRWVHAQTPGNVARLTESSIGDTGAVVWENTASSANYVKEDFDGFHFPRGIRVAQLDDGELFVYIANRRGR